MFQKFDFRAVFGDQSTTLTLALALALALALTLTLTLSAFSLGLASHGGELSGCLMASGPAAQCQCLL